MTLAERLAELIWRAHEGDYAALRRLVAATGGRWEENEPGAGASSAGGAAVTASGMRVGFPAGGMDTAAAMAQTVLALWGPLGFALGETHEAGRILRRRARDAARAVRGRRR